MWPEYSPRVTAILRPSREVDRWVSSSHPPGTGNNSSPSIVITSERSGPSTTTTFSDAKNGCPVPHFG